ncbi:MAG: hypothetical protein Q8L55_11210 [Phycisphaerales bacterium]|nr:hypothetical protein [Phycisphaerales bacterium]
MPILSHARLTTRTLVLTAIAGLSLSFPTLVAAQQPSGQAKPQQTAAEAKDLPVTDITLYRSGVGYFLRKGVVDGSQRVSLRFDVNQINDVLKSMQVLDLDKGRIDAVSFASKDPLDRRLRSFSINIGDNPSLPSLLERLRGTPVTLKTSTGEFTGTVLSVESRKVSAGDKGQVIDTPVVNLITAGGIKSVTVTDVQNFTINDAKIAEEMNKALAALADSRAERIKSLDFSLSGEGSRRIAVAYVHESPVWKASYRLLLPESVDPTKPDPTDIAPVLKGWALVENVTDNDWNNVKLSLVSGRPVSFKMDISEPMYVWRPEIPVPTVAGVMPKEYGGGTDAATARVELARRDAEKDKMMLSDPRSPAAPAAAPMEFAARKASSALGAASRPGSGGGRAGSDFDVTGSDMADYGGRSVAKGGEVGEVFQYTLSNPVTIERQRSAMIPIIDANIQGRRVSIYNMADRADHPMRGAEITNSSGGQLLPGPLAVYDGAAYAGDAQVGQVSAGDKRLIAYALDLDVAVVTKPVNEWNITSFKFVNGLLMRTSKVIQGVEYVFDNKDAKRGRNIVLEHPKMDGWELKDVKAAEETQGLYRFNLAVEASKTVATKVIQERTDVSQIGVFDYDVKSLLTYQQQGKISKAVLDAITEAGRRQGVINDLQRRAAETDQAIETTKRDQSQLVDMMNKLDRQNPNYATFSTRLGKASEKLDGLERLKAATASELETARNEFNGYLAGLNIQ